MAIKIAKHIKLPLALLATMTIAGSCTAATVSTSYQVSNEDFPNPERGFFSSSMSTQEDSPLDLSTVQNVKNNNHTLIRRIYNIPNYRNSALPQSFLDLIAKDCESARKGGVKLFLRFAYNFEWEGPDARRDIILSHLDQLKPVLEKNKDVIAFMEAGFIGSWGEWHHSTNGLDNSGDRRTILNKILSVLPTDRMVAVRVPTYKTDALNNSNALTPQEAFNSSYRARTGHHNDCFLASADDAGTYDSSNPEKTKNFLNLDTRYIVQGGETCTTSEYDDCPNALKDLERMHWSYLNRWFEENVLKGWQDQGCLETVKRRLGYRFRLIDSNIPDKVKPNGTFSMSFKVTNEGWASPYNPRSLEVVLRNKNTGQQYYLPVSEAVRMWMPGETKTVNITGGIPSTMPSGEYQVLLNLPDPTSTLRNRPEYSIRLANQNVWEASTGYNSLLRSVIVDPNAGGETYSGSQLFKASGGGNSQTPSNNSSKTVTFYEDSNFSGKSQSFGVGTYRADKGQLNQVGNDNISSLRVPAGYKVRVCSDETGGICREYGAGDYSYVGDDLNDQISLVEVKVQ